MECYHCHGSFNFTDNIQHSKLPLAEIGFHNTGLYNRDGRGAYPANNPGIAEFTGDPNDEGKFRTPSLRNVALTGPYMHDGSIPTLDQVIRAHYAQAGRAGQGPNGPSPMRSYLIAGFEVTDRIDVKIDTTEVIMHSIKQFETYICQEVLANHILFTALSSGQKETIEAEGDTLFNITKSN